MSLTNAMDLQVAFPSLERLKLSHMENLKIIWPDQFAGYSFFKLQFLKVEFCESLMHIFQSNMLTRFHSLETLSVTDCGVEEIVVRDEGAVGTVLFPKVTHLILRKLPKLKWLYQGVQTLEWPLLKELEVSDCDQLRIFATKNLNFHETIEQSQLESSIQQPLFLVQEVRH